MANDKKTFNGWISNSLTINQSPFYKESHHGKYIHGKPKKQKDMRIPMSIYNDLMTYFKGNGLNWTDGMNNLIYEKLEMINTFKRTVFSNIELIMIIPKTKSLTELNEGSLILTVYNSKTDFKNSYIYHDGFGRNFNFNYELSDFSFFPIDILRNLKKDTDFILNGHNPYNSLEWKEYHKRLEDFYELDLSKCYFVRFPLNNYLDINREGQFQSSRLRGWHEGLYVFDDFNHYRLYYKMEWKYDSSGQMRFRGEFLPMSEFMYILKNADMRKVRDSHESLLNNVHDKEFMESALKDAEEMKEWIEEHIAFYKKNLGR